MKNSMTITFLACLLAAGLCCVKPAIAQTGIDDGLGGIPPADLFGWFLTFDPSDQWTSASNVATMESWLWVAEDIQNNPDLLQELYGLGMTSAQITALNQTLDADYPINDDRTADSTPEPATLVLFGGALGLLACYVFRRSRQTDRPRILCLATKD